MTTTDLFTNREQEMLLRHALAVLPNKQTRVGNPADPTEYEVFNGYLGFEYDPWLMDDEVTDHPAMGTVWSVRATYMWDTLEITLSCAGSDLVRVLRLTPGGLASGDWDELDMILDQGVFGKQPIDVATID